MASDPQLSSLFDTSNPGSNLPEYGVGEISKLLKKAVEENFGLVRVRGEISGLKIAPSGHIYFDLKDQDALLASICWKGQAGKLGIRLESGMEVVCSGRLTTYMLRSNYQLIVERVVLAGRGALLKLLEERKKKLTAEGLFDPARKQLLPFLPEVIGVITSPTGSVIRDILHRLADRFPRHVLIWPVAVQGEGSAEQIAAAIEGFNRLEEKGKPPRPDLLIVARGGGSVEDLMAFNEEVVVRAAARSHIPLISAIGHETDTTLIDFAADIRAPTPTAAAEMAVPVRESLLTQTHENATRLRLAIRRKLDDGLERIHMLDRALGDPARTIEPLLQRFDERSERLTRAWQGYFERRVSRIMELSGQLKHPRDLLYIATQHLQSLEHNMLGLWREFYIRRESRVETLGTVLGHLSPKAVLGRGYVLVQKKDGGLVTSSQDIEVQQIINIEFHDGRRTAVIKE